MRLLPIKIVHTFAFFVLSGCVILVVYSGAFNRINNWTWAGIGMILAEGIALASCGGKCPLTVIAEREGAIQPGVADIFLPKWFADRIFPICGSTFVVGCLLVAWRLVGS
ncbi:MAG: hypothetical protein ABI565_13090 [Vicinamibacteria bacterium]